MVGTNAVYDEIMLPDDCIKGVFLHKFEEFEYSLSLLKKRPPLIKSNYNITFTYLRFVFQLCHFLSVKTH